MEWTTSTRQAALRILIGGTVAGAFALMVAHVVEVRRQGMVLLDRENAALTLRRSVGRVLPDVLLRDVPAGDSLRLLPYVTQGPAVLWVIESNDCLVCLAEGQEWSSFARHHPNVQVVGVANGRITPALRSLATEENLGFPILQDSLGLLRQGLGLTGSHPIRIVALNRRIVSIAEGREGDGLTTLEMADLVICGMAYADSPFRAARVGMSAEPIVRRSWR